MKKSIVTIALLLLTCIACTTKKEINSSAVKMEHEKETDEQLVKEGYIAAIVLDKSQEGCNYVLKNIASEEIMLPIELEDRFKTNNTKVWLKFRPIRPTQNGCSLGIPISIEEIKLSK